MRLPVWFGPALLIAVFASCKSREAKEQERVDARLSWVATAGAVTRGWLDNRLPVRYAERVLDEARDELTRNDDTTSARIVASLGEAVRRRDRAAVGAPMASLVGEWSQLHEQSEKLKGSQ